MIGSNVIATLRAMRDSADEVAAMFASGEAEAELQRAYPIPLQSPTINEES